MSEEKISLTEKKNVNDGLKKPGDDGYVVPAELAPIPSEGKLYSVDHPLHMCDCVEIKAMSGEEEDILTSRALLKQGKVSEALISSCVMDKRVEPNTLVIGDRNAILISIRVTGYGSSYDVFVFCPLCDRKQRKQFELSKMKIKKLGRDPLELGKNLFDFELPVTRKMIEFSLLTGTDEDDISKTIEKQHKIALEASKGNPNALIVDKTVTLRNFYMIKSIDGNRDKQNIARFVRTMPAGDSLAFRNHVKEISPDIDMSSEFECEDSDCEYVGRVEVPIGPDFFWPGA